jgi:hypothetical protein|nr:MAG TPA: hypothetical protein [Caudoviricetes sp.]DAR63501.1 MAG TPA: hypothetical protein [Caudoviricetes sp.]DAX37892.1 MAG TPA: hypothetical protein [Caudoviricetes sp.]
MRLNSPEATEINKRFFLVIDYLVKKKIIRGLNTFTKMHNINYWNLCTVKNEPERRVLKVEYIAYLAKDFNISLEYILFGDTPMRKE